MKTMIKKPNNEPTILELDSINDISAYFNGLCTIYIKNQKQKGGE